jgi:formate hydrogenlyase subunit 3/multisubunit Na+/H+ antiporter MnhD subunit
VPIAALGAVAFAILGALAHPDRTALLRSLSFGLLLLAMLVALLGYVVPTFLVPILSDSAWAGVPKQLAADELPLMLGLVLVLVGGAGACFAAAGMLTRRRRWSTPISTHRYNERHWS